MKLNVIADGEGNILATANVATSHGGAPSSGGLIAGPGETIHQLDVPDSVANLEAALLHWRYRLEVRPGVARLVELAQPIAEP
jgi:hypothetical protein